MDKDRNLLFCILAAQLDFIPRDAMMAGMNAWMKDKGKPLGAHFVELGFLKASDVPLIDALVDKHFVKHGAKDQTPVDGTKATLDIKDSKDADATAAHAPREPGRYRILRAHARGGLGEVFVARDTELNREVALKEIQARHADDPDSRGRFVLEAEITGGLEHPGIVPVYGFGAYPDGRPFYAMRFIRGESLKEAIETFHLTQWTDAGDRNLAFRGLLKRFADACYAVAYAHSRGIVHRDLKPGNVMLGKYGETLVVDWGLAKAIDAPEVARGQAVAEVALQPTSGSSYVETMAGRAVGTPAFMPPEQAEGRLDQLGPPSDVYALGATLYVILTGEVAFRGDIFDVIKKVINGDFKSPRSLKPNVPAALDAVVLKAMSLKPDDRYVSVLDLAKEIEQYLADEPVRAYREPFIARARRWARRHRTLVAGGSALLITVLAASAVGYYLVGKERRQKREAKHNEQLQIAKADAAVKQAEINRFHSTLERIRQRRLTAPQGWTAANLAEIRPLLDSPTAAEYRSALRTEAAAALSALDPVVVQTIALDTLGYIPAHHPDGKTLAVGSWKTSIITGAGSVSLWDLESGKLQRTFRLPARKGVKKDDGCRRMAFSPDGRWLVAGTVSGNLHRWDLKSEAPDPVTEEAHPHDIGSISFSADGKRLISSSSKSIQVAEIEKGLKAVRRIDGDGLDCAGVGALPREWILFNKDGWKWRSTANLEEPVFPDEKLVVRGLRFADPSGRIVYRHEYDRIEVLAPGGDDVGVFPSSQGETHPPSGAVQFALNPDRSVLAICYEGAGEVRLYDTAGGTLTARLTLPGPNHSLRFSFSPDGSRLVVVAGVKALVYELARSGVRRTQAVDHLKIADFHMPSETATAYVCRVNGPHSESTPWDVTRNAARSGPVKPPMAYHRIFSDATDSLRIRTATNGGKPGEYKLQLFAGDDWKVVIDTPVDPKEYDYNDFRFESPERVWALGSHTVERCTTTDGKWRILAKTPKDLVERRVGNVWRCFDARGGEVYAGRRYGTVVRFNEDIKPERSWNLCEVPIDALYVTTGGAVAGTGVGELVWLDCDVAEPTRRIPAHARGVTGIAPLDGTHLVSASADRSLSIWTLEGDAVCTLFESAPIDKLAVNRAGMAVTISHFERGLRTWDLPRLRKELLAIHPELGW